MYSFGIFGSCLPKMFFSVTSRSIFSGDPSFVMMAKRTSLDVRDAALLLLLLLLLLLSCLTAAFAAPRAFGGGALKGGTFGGVGAPFNPLLLPAPGVLLLSSLLVLDSLALAAEWAKRASMKASLEDMDAGAVEAEEGDEEEEDEDEVEDISLDSPSSTFCRLLDAEGSMALRLSDSVR